MIPEWLDGLVGGGLVLMVSGYMLALVRDVPKKIGHVFVRRFVTIVEIPNTSVAFRWVERWLDSHPSTASSTLVTVSAQMRKDVFDGKGPREQRNDETPEVFFSPAPGLHLLRHGRCWFMLRRTRQENASDTSGGFGAPPREYLTLYSLGRSQQPIRELLDEAQELCFPSDVKRVIVWIQSYESWRVGTELEPRSIESVVLADDQAGRVLDDMRWFLGASKWYRERGVPYRRGYLLHGPSGGGKTSLVHAVASELGLNIYYLSLSAGIPQQALQVLVSSIPRGSILLVEDVDSPLTRDREKDSDTDPAAGLMRATLSDVLNAIDGVVASSGRILVMTTNLKDMLDTALTRPGRSDVDVEIGHASAEQAERLFTRFFPGRVTAAREFAGLVPCGTSMAAVQEILVKAHESYSIALDMARKEWTRG